MSKASIMLWKNFKGREDWFGPPSHVISEARVGPPYQSSVYELPTSNESHLTGLSRGRSGFIPRFFQLLFCRSAISRDKPAPTKDNLPSSHASARSIPLVPLAVFIFLFPKLANANPVPSTRLQEVIVAQASSNAETRKVQDAKHVSTGKKEPEKDPSFAE